ncbi:crossover junction endonuclease MUS81-like isoform X2 [Stegodyphus dumicola]|uniref:crossover junction endonuclease MUS81-like isoform X2 n=2 Tax=Stegodyphus dumicola TaxID=202533 RepID=UPI0015AF12B9|nr:crossover junction endonuclease MUS81-like isoform X2 [Stegodyphus dumicola]
METNLKQRKKKKYPKPNPLFEKWLTEWKDDAKEKGLKTQYVYAKALSSLKKYPLPLSSGKEAKILEYFGDKICAMLDAKLLEWKQANSSPSCSQSSSEASSSSEKPLSHPVRSKPKEVVSSVTENPEIKTIHRGRIEKLLQEPTEIDLCYSENPSFSLFYLYPGSFSIILCVDNCETSTGQGKNKKLFVTELQKHSVEFEIRKLHVGDFLWVARENCSNPRELVLDFIIERKRVDDLAKSIKDGRFKEQKFRMKNCALKHPMYLVENHSSVKHCGLPESTLEQAIVNTQIIDGFFVKRTQGIRESVAYLSVMTKLIKNKYQNQTLVSAPKEAMQKKKCSSYSFMTFKEFNCSSVKNKTLTVKEMFAKQLLQFFGLSVDRAAAIVSHFETPTKFLEAYDKCRTEEEKIQMVSCIKFGASKNEN